MQKIPYLLILFITFTLSFLTFKYDLYYIVGLSKDTFFGGDYWQVLTFSFVHGNFVHLLFNVIAFISFAPFVAEHLKPKMFSLLVLSTILVSSITWFVIAEPEMFVLGLSGVVLSILAYWSVYNYDKNILFFFIPVNVLSCLLIFFVLSILCIIFDWVPIFAHSIHIVGLVTGFAFAFILDPTSFKQLKLPNPLSKDPKRIHFFNRHKSLFLSTSTFKFLILSGGATIFVNSIFLLSLLNIPFIYYLSSTSIFSFLTLFCFFSALFICFTSYNLYGIFILYSMLLASLYTSPYFHLFTLSISLLMIVSATKHSMFCKNILEKIYLLFKENTDPLILSSLVEFYNTKNFSPVLTNFLKPIYAFCKDNNNLSFYNNTIEDIITIASESFVNSELYKTSTDKNKL